MIDLDELGQRLRELPVEQPDPGAVAARVLANHRSVATRRSWSLPPMVRPFAAVVAGLIVLWGVFYMSPATGAALADAPGVGTFSSFVLQEVGLGSGSSVTPENAVVSQSGVTIRLLGVSANPIHTLLLLNISPKTYLPMGASLTDQFGISYEERGGYGDLRTGDWAAIFAPPSGVASAVGMRFTLTFNGISTGQGVIQGTWAFHGIALVHTGVTFSAPAAAAMGEVTITFSNGRVVDGILEMNARVRGVTMDQLGLSQKQTADAVPPLLVEVYDSGGNQLAVPYDFGPDNTGLSIDVIAYGAADHGRYTLRISIQGFGSVDRSISY
jgi:hypothetical protein